MVVKKCIEARTVSKQDRSETMAQISERLSYNASGQFFVDSTCIDCGICRWVAPSSFGRSDDNGLSFVKAQPVSSDDRRRALMALVACPTASIGTVDRLDATEGVEAFPERLEETVYFCGFASKDSYGAASYFLTRPAGNMLVDSPRAAAPLLRNLARLGGVARMFLSHKDDVADHARFRDRFGCDRILHRDDVTRSTSGIERLLEGKDPIRIDEDLLAVPVPGHTRGSCALLYRDHVLFTGDHLWGDSETATLDASRSVCWYSWTEQIRSMERLLDLRFEWVLPGHGDPYRAHSATAMRAEVESLIARMRSMA